MAQPSVKKVQVIMVPDHSDAVYKLGEKVKMQVIALDCGVKLNDVEVKYQISKDLMPAHKEGALKLKGNEGVIEAGTMKEPGYLRVKATVQHEGKSYTSYSTVGCAPEKLQPVVQEPEDFEEFWAKNLQQVAKVPLAPKMELLPDRGRFPTGEASSRHL